MPPDLVDPKYGEIVFGNEKWPYLLGHSGDGPPALYVDADQDVDFTNDPAPKRTEQETSDETTHDVEFDIRLPDGQPAHVGAHPRYPSDTLSRHADFGCIAMMKVDDETFLMISNGIVHTDSTFRVCSYPKTRPQGTPQKIAKVGQSFEINGTECLLRVGDGKLPIKGN